jgi:hypothetical protein
MGKRAPFIQEGCWPSCTQPAGASQPLGRDCSRPPQEGGGDLRGIMPPAWAAAAGDARIPGRRRPDRRREALLLPGGARVAARCNLVCAMSHREVRWLIQPMNTQTAPVATHGVPGSHTPQLGGSSQGPHSRAERGDRRGSLLSLGDLARGRIHAGGGHGKIAKNAIYVGAPYVFRNANQWHR